MLNYKMRGERKMYSDRDKYARRCIDGRITGCGNCVGYCNYIGHSGFLTKKLQKQHDCIKKGCNYYTPKHKYAPLKKLVDERPFEVVQIASSLVSDLEGIRIINADKASDGGWAVSYVCITNEYSITELEKAISRATGEAIALVKLNYDFDRAVRLIFAWQKRRNEMSLFGGFFDLDGNGVTSLDEDLFAVSVLEDNKEFNAASHLEDDILSSFLEDDKHL